MAAMLVSIRNTRLTFLSLAGAGRDPGVGADRDTPDRGLLPLARLRPGPVRRPHVGCFLCARYPFLMSEVSFLCTPFL